MPQPKISIIAAMGNGSKFPRVIGKENKLLWHIPEDLKRFKSLTNGHSVIMGRKTFESIIAILGKPLPNRTNIVVTRNLDWKYEGALSATSIEEAIELARHKPGSDEIFIGGGAEIYTQALKYADRLYLTLVEDDVEGDSFFPPYEHQFKRCSYPEERDHNGLKYTWIDLERDSTR